MFAEVHSFTDPQQHAMAIRGWRQTYDQLSGGCLSSELWQISGERFQIFQEVMDKRIVQHGCAPTGRLCIAMSLGRGPTPVVQGHQLGERSVVMLRDGEEFMLHAPEGLSFFAVNVDAARFAEMAAIEFSPEQLRNLNAVSGVEVPAQVIERVRLRLVSVSRCLLGRKGEVGAASEKMIEDTLLEAFLDLFSDARSEVRERRRNLAVCSYLVRRSQELALADSRTPLSVLDLCERLRVSRRTLQNSFQAVACTRPVEYLRNVRLNAVRRRLMSTSAAEASVGEIAAEMGFYHLSHFAANYRALFGECPSATARADGWSEAVH